MTSGPEEKEVPPVSSLFALPFILPLGPGLAPFHVLCLSPFRFPRCTAGGGGMPYAWFSRIIGLTPLSSPLRQAGLLPRNQAFDQNRQNGGELISDKPFRSFFLLTMSFRRAKS